MDIQDGEMTEDALRVNYQWLVDEALSAFSVDNSYATEICLKARAIQDRRAKKIAQLQSQ